MAARRDLLGRLTDLSEEAIGRLAEVPGGDRVFKAVNSMRDQVVELQKRVRGLEDLDRRLAALEKKVEKLSKSTAAAASKTPPARRAAPKKPSS
jgi:uncharacterized coiled-coil protein SlyX